MGYTQFAKGATNMHTTPNGRRGLTVLVALALTIFPLSVAADNYWQCLLDHRSSITGQAPLKAADSFCKKKYPIPTRMTAECGDEELKKRRKKFISSLVSGYNPSGGYPSKEDCVKTVVAYPKPSKKWPWSPQSIEECILKYSKGIENKYGQHAVSKACQVLYRDE
jgi:hypothetical protein